MANQTFTLMVDNMSCGHCTGRVEKTLKSIAGISDISVDLADKKASFSAPGEKQAKQAVEAVTKAGYPALLK